MSLTPEIDRRDDLLKVRDQGRLPTCLSYSISTVHRVNKDIDTYLSAESLHYHATEGDWCRGSKIVEVQEALMQKGQPEDRHCATISCEDAQGWTPPTDVEYYHANSTKTISSPDTVKEAIRDLELPIIGIEIPQEFHQPNPPWVISAGQKQNLHAVVAVGLAKYEGETVVLIRNSWGEEWANSGYAWLDNSFLEKHLRKVLVLSDDYEI